MSASLLLALVLLQAGAARPAPPAPAPVPVPVPAPEPVPVPAPDGDLDLVLGGAEAPAQPLGSASAAAVVRTARGGAGLGSGVDPRAVTVPIGAVVAVRGQEENAVQGIGLVTGLAGTGDSVTAAKQALLNLLQTQNVVLDPQAIASNNVAVVLVQATLPPGVKPGRRLDVRVSSIYDCESLVGGTLVFSELTDVTGRFVYVTATGPISTGAFSFEGDGATATRNHPTVGTVPLGGKVERSVPTRLVSDQGLVYLDLKPLEGSFGNALRVAESIDALYPGAAIALDAMTVAVRLPQDLPESSHVAFLDTILSREIEPVRRARVVINERTGVIVMGEGVRISRGAITKGNLTVTVAESPEASQPGPLSSGTTEVLPRTSLLVEEEDASLSLVEGAVTLQEVVEVLNVLGVTPRDLIQILQSMAQSGMLHAQIVVL